GQNHTPRDDPRGLRLHLGPLIRGLVDPHPAANVKEEPGIAAARLCSRTRRARNDPHGPAVHRRLSLQLQIEELGYLREKGVLTLTLALAILQTAQPLRRCFSAQLLCGVVQLLLFAALLPRAERLAVPLDDPAVRLPVQDERLPSLLLRGLDLS